MQRTALTAVLKPLPTALILMALGLLVLIRGVVPAMRAIDTDFPNYFTAARIVASGQDAARLYDDDWFREQMRREIPDRPAVGKFAPFPPPTALLLLPLTHLTPLSALRASAGISLISLLISIFLLARATELTASEAALVVLLAGYAICSNLRFGQPYMLVCAACIGGYVAWLRNRPIVAGLLLGVFVPIKYFPIYIVLYLLWRRQWQVVIGALISAVAVVLISIAALGWQVHEAFLRGVLGAHLVGELTGQNPFATAFQSFDALYRQLFVPDPTLNPHPWVAAPQWQPVAVALTKCAFAAWVVAVLRCSSGGAAGAIGLLGILMLLIAPATASYHFVLLWLPVGLLVSLQLQAHAIKHATVMLLAYALIGFFPYGRVAHFSGNGIWSVLAFPRLLLLATLLAVASHFLWRRKTST